MSKQARNRLSWIATAALTATVVLFTATAPDPAEDRARALGLQIRCPVCQGESIADSPSETARDMMDLVRQRIAEGLTDEQIIDELLASYSGALLLDPPVAGSTLWVWIAPVVALGVGLVLIIRRVRPVPRPAGSEASPAVDHLEAVASADATASGRRLAMGAVGLMVVAAGVLVAVGQFRQSRTADDLFTGVAGSDVDPASVSNETLEAVIAANLDNPDIGGMRLALANRYFEERNYQKAFPHYQAILEDEPNPTQAAAAYTRLGWMVYDGNGEVELGLSLIDNALELAPDDPFALYLKGRLVWCGQNNNERAAELFNQVLTAPGLTDDVQGQVEEVLAVVEAGGTCP
ncbi:MAG: cytochrome c-type biogenesis protein CcmH [Acidimicrobiia bacterium]